MSVAAFDPLEGLVDVDQDDDVDRRDDQQEGRRHRDADQATDRAKVLEPMLEGVGCEHDADRRQDDNR